MIDASQTRSYIIANQCLDRSELWGKTGRPPFNCLSTESPAFIFSQSRVQCLSSARAHLTYFDDQCDASLDAILAPALSVEDDWDGYGGLKPSEGAINDARAFLRHAARLMGRLIAAPTGSGGIAMYARNKSFVAEFSFDGSGCCLLVMGAINEDDVVSRAFPITRENVIARIQSVKAELASHHG